MVGQINHHLYRKRGFYYFCRRVPKALLEHYPKPRIVNANSASAALNKWLKPRANEDAVVHSLRHSMRDRLRVVECPSDIIDQIGGWSSSTVGSSYGKGYELPVLAKWMKMMEE